MKEKKRGRGVATFPTNSGIFVLSNKNLEAKKNTKKRMNRKKSGFKANEINI